MACSHEAISNSSSGLPPADAGSKRTREGLDARTAIKPEKTHRLSVERTHWLLGHEPEASLVSTGCRV